ncbi:MAG: AMMECR1 domain-containing protein [Bacteroidales bacterium]|nr:AMMECR1 domain-containing protein [Bacteroidales bacterium]MBS3775937.1 AMMECR1 domain-containing protein [Bacteroidales bacterium]
MFEPRTIYAKIAYDALLLYMKTGKKIFKEEAEVPSALKLKLPCFVSIYSNGKLRGNKGSVEPQHNCLYNEIIENAASAVDEAGKTEPLKEGELHNITLAVDVLSNPKPVENKSLLKPEKHGVIVEDESGNKAYVLPNTEGIDSIEKQMEVAREKAGIDAKVPQDKLKVLNFTMTRYQ